MPATTQTVLRDTIRNMTETELYDAIYTDPLTGAFNRRAWAVTGAGQPWVGLVDLDSLKYVNDTVGHRAGDQYLLDLVEALSQRFDGRIYRMAGDEFAVTGDDKLDVFQQLLAVQRKYPLFSFGVGATLEIADGLLQHDKAGRMRTGERAARGDCPPWLGRVAS